MTKGEQFKVTSLPLAIINPEEALIEQAEIGTILECTIGFSVILVIRETEPTNWFDDVITVMGDVVDKILSDRTLNGAVKDVRPSYFAPGEIAFRNRLYYGGLVRFTALMYHTP